MKRSDQLPAWKAVAVRGADELSERRTSHSIAGIALHRVVTASLCDRFWQAMSVQAEFCCATNVALR